MILREFCLAVSLAPEGSQKKMSGESEAGNMAVAFHSSLLFQLFQGVEMHSGKCSFPSVWHLDACFQEMHLVARMLFEILGLRKIKTGWKTDGRVVLITHRVGRSRRSYLVWPVCLS